MNVFLEPIGLHSRSMLRTARALERYAPSGVRVVQSQEDADLAILHVIGYDALEIAEGIYASGRDYAVLQYCLRSTEYTREEDWLELWHNASIVMSYYDLSRWMSALSTPFYHAPLGIDDAFIRPTAQIDRERVVITSGFVSGPSAEAIEEVWRAARIAGVGAIHLGPSQVEGMKTYIDLQSARYDITDEELSALYQSATWVSGLRHTEGFELPCAEGLSCGARPIMFRQPAIKHWYGDFAEYVEDRSGQALVDDLVRIFTGRYHAVDIAEQEQAVTRFDWQPICTGFWQRAIAAMECAA